METPALDVPRILPETVDRHLYRRIHGLPHSPVGDRYVTILSDLGEGLGEAAAVVCQYMYHAEGQGSGRFAQESDGTG